MCCALHTHARLSKGFGLSLKGGSSNAAVTSSRTTDAFWTIVATPPQELVLASVEAGAELILPEWIRSELLREITGVKKYEPEALARARAKSADRSR